MTNRISGPGVGLQVPQYLYPTALAGAPYDFANNTISLAAGDSIAVPAGNWRVTLGGVSLLQVLDPVTGIWRLDGSQRGQASDVYSDGFTTRIANLTGCPIAAVVTGGGSGYVQASTTAVSSAGGSTWQPIVGGSASVVSVTAVGANYGVAPLVLIPAPPGAAANGVGGVPATAYATISAGTVSGVTLSNVGAGYSTAPVGIIAPNPADPNIATITNATVTFGLTNAGKITAVLCTGNGNVVAAAPTITVAGTGGSGSTVSAVLLQTVTSASISGAGVGYGTVAEVSTVGGVPTAGTFVNPAIELSGWRPRKASIGVTTLTAGSLVTLGTIYDSGLFAVGNAPGVLVNGNGVVSTAATVLLTLGGATDTVILQQLL